MMRKVTIIIPVYNTEKYVIRCLDSIKDQKYEDIQVIIVNDGSTDNSEEIIIEYINKNRFFAEYYKKDNGGLSSARNYGLKYVKGKYLLFLDSDDYLTSNAIECFVSKSDGMNIVIGDFIDEKPSGERKQQKYPYFDVIKFHNMNNLDYYRFLYESRYGISACNKLYDYEFLKNTNVKFQKNSEIYAEDLLFNLKLLKYNPTIKILHEGTYYYYQNNTSITHTYKGDLAKRFSALISDYYQYNLYDFRGVAFAIANAINTICAQERKILDSIKELKIFQKGLEEGIKTNRKKLLESVEGLPISRKIDYSISIKFIFCNVFIIGLYQSIKRRLIK